MTEPYVKANPGDPILSENWNTLQVRLIEALRTAIRTHTHLGGDDGKKLVGSSIDPNTTLSVKQVDVLASLSVKGLNVFDRLTGLGTEKLSVTGGTVSGPLTVSANVGIGAAAGAARLEVRGASSDDKASALRVTNSTGGVLLEVRNDGAINLHDRPLYLRGTNDTYHGIRWDADVRGPRVFGFQGGQLATTTSTNDMVALQWSGSDVHVMGDLTVGGRFTPHFDSKWIASKASDTTVIPVDVGFFPVLVSVMAKMSDEQTFVHIPPANQSWDDIFNRGETCFTVFNDTVRIHPYAAEPGANIRLYDGPDGRRFFRVLAWRVD